MSSSSDLSGESIANLVRRARDDDRAAETELCRRFSAAVHAFARRRLRSAEAVDEFAQDVFVRLIEALRRGAVEDPERTGGFVLGICKNLALDRVRQRERRDALWAQHQHLFSVITPEALDTPTHDHMKLEDCVAQLSQRSRDVLRYSYVDTLSHVEVATKLSISEANARVLRHRTLHALRECMSRPIPWEAA